MDSVLRVRMVGSFKRLDVDSQYSIISLINVKQTKKTVRDYNGERFSLIGKHKECSVPTHTYCMYLLRSKLIKLKNHKPTRTQFNVHRFQKETP